MTEPTAELIDELRMTNARLEGRIEELGAELAAMTATEAQLRVELEQARAQTAAAETALADSQRLAGAREATLRQRVADLEERLGEAKATQARAEDERAAVIAALGRRARRKLA